MSSFDYNTNKAIGIAKRMFNCDHVAIYAVGYMDSDNHFVGLNANEAKAVFKPHGRIFAPGFAKPVKNQQYIDKMICLDLKCADNFEDGGNNDKYLIDYSGSTWVYSDIEVEDLGDDEINDDNNNNALIVNNCCAANKYYSSGKYIYRINGADRKVGIIEYWVVNDALLERNKNLICKYENHYYFVKDDIEERCDGYFDFFTDENIATFIMNLAKMAKLPINQVSTLRDFAENLKIPKGILEERLCKFEDILSMYTLTYDGIKKLAGSPLLSEVVSKSIQGYREDYIKAFEIQHKADIDKLKADYEDKKIAFETSFEEMKEKIRDEHRAELSTAAATIKSKKEVLSELDTKMSEKTIAVDALTEQLSMLEARKEQIIADYSVVREVMGNITPNAVSEKNRLKINNIDNEGAEISDLKGFIAYIKQNITNSNLRADKQITIAICELFLTYRVLMLPDIRMIKAIINTIGKCKSLSVSVGVNWNSFEHLWNGGLSDIVDSCKNDEQTVHILALQNMNLSYIPCYMSPINDIIIGLSSTLPNGCQLPSNLWIIGTRSKERAMDIPEEYIREYGCLKYGEEYYCVNEHCEIESQYITMNTIESLPQVTTTSDYKSYIDEEL